MGEFGIVFLTPFNVFILGHNGAVQSVNFSNDGKLLLTSSADNTASIWSSACSEPILTFTNQKCTSRADSKVGKKQA